MYSRMKLNRRAVALFALAAGFLALCLTGAGANEWPREIQSGKARIVMYQPQLESYEGDELSGRAAVMVKENEEAEPVFGAFWMDARVSTDRETRMVELLDVKVTNVKFPNVKGDKTEKLADLLEREIPTWELSFSMDDLLAELDLVKKERASSEDLKNDPPRIIYAMEPSVLVVIDGKPLLRDIENTKYKYVVNTPYFIIEDASSQRYYLKGGDYWYASKDVVDGWEETENPPKEIVEIAEKHVQKPEEAITDDAAGEGVEAGGAAEEPAEKIVPKIVVTTEPAELIQTNGKPEYASVEGTKLLYAKNTENDVLLDIDTQQHYVLLSGRWYASKSLENGPWRFVPPDELPDGFADVPPESDMGSVRTSVPGTDEAREAVLENEIPQTAAVSRKDATVQVTYDGDPKFEQIEGTSMSYAVNTDKSVLLIEGKYYCCDNAVWFTAPAPKGPWTVCVDVPRDVQSIPPASPVYNVKYVYVYDSTPEVVYVGYTPGYYGSYVYGGCVVYGTGYYYRPWYGAYYYPRPVTYGFSVHYNPWTGWGFGFGMSYGWFHAGFYSHPGGWWGPAGYHGGYRHGYYHGYHHGYAHGYRQGMYAGYRAGQAAARPAPNLYNKRDGVRYTGTKQRPSVSTADRRAPGTPSQRPTRDIAAQDRTRPGAQPGTRETRDLQQPPTREAKSLQQPSTRANDHFADKNGNVYRKNDSGWEKKDKTGWSNMDAGKSSRDRSQTQQTQQQLNRQYDARQRGAARTQSYQQGSPPPRSKPSATRQPSRSGGARRR